MYLGNINPFLAKLILRLSHFFHKLTLVCKGYNGDYENFTELVWTDDKYLDFYDTETYPEFQLWIR